MAELKTVDLTHVYSQGTPFENTAIDSINITVPQGQLVGIIGDTGSGKSTLIQHFNALLLPTSGQIMLDGVDINKDKETRVKSRWRVGLVFQYPEYQLFEETVYADIAFGPKNMGLDKDEVDRRVRTAAQFAGNITEEMFQKSPFDLSGGQKRSVAIAGVIAMEPEILVLDEPCAGLDPEACRQVIDNIVNYRDRTGSTVMIVSHNMDDVARIADRIIVLSHGKIAMDGTPDEVFADPEPLRAMGLDIPKSTELAMALKAAGLDLKGSIYTHAQLLQAVLEAKGAGKC